MLEWNSGKSGQSPSIRRWLWMSASAILPQALNGTDKRTETVFHRGGLVERIGTYL